MTVFNRATLIISQAVKKTAAVPDAKAISDEMRKKVQAMPVAPASEYKGQIQRPAKTSSDFGPGTSVPDSDKPETGPVSVDEVTKARLPVTADELKAAIAKSNASTGARNLAGNPAQYRELAGPPSPRPPTAQEAIQQKHTAKFGPSPDQMGANAAVPQYPSKAPAGPGLSPEDYKGFKAPAPAAPSLLDQAKGYGSQYVQAMKDLNPYAIGGTALVAGGTAALLHHLLSGKKNRKTAANSPIGTLLGGGTAAEKAAARAAAIQANIDRARGQLKGTPPAPSAVKAPASPASPLAGAPNAPRLGAPGPHGEVLPHAPVAGPSTTTGKPMSQADIDELMRSLGLPSVKSPPAAVPAAAPAAAPAGPSLTGSAPYGASKPTPAAVPTSTPAATPPLAAPAPAPSGVPAPTSAPANGPYQGPFMGGAGPGHKSAPLTAPLKALRGNLRLAARQHPVVTTAAAGAVPAAGLIYAATPGDATPGSHVERAQTAGVNPAAGTTHENRAPATPAPAATSTAPSAGSDGKSGGKGDGKTEPSLWDKAKGYGQQYMDNIAKGDMPTILGTAGAVGGAALLHHLLTKRSRRDEE